jgi:CoA:oxalate CoA-transferase
MGKTIEKKVRPLAGIRVLGLEQYVAGPYCTMLLADAGAEVIKIEPPQKGDPRRSLPPFAFNDRNERSSGGFMRFNRNKKSLTLDVKKAEGKRILSELIMKSDVLVENFRPGTIERLGFSYEKVHALNPAIIYASLSGFGKGSNLRGPYWDRPGFDIVFQAMGGLMHNVGEENGPPLFLGITLADLHAPMVMAYAILLALRMREKTGEGQYVDIAMYDCMAALNEGAVAIHSYTGEIPGRNRPRIQAPLNAFKTKDGYVALMVPTEEMWRRFCKAITREDLIGQPLLASGPLRAKHYNTLLQPVLDEWMIARTTDEVTQIMLNHGIPVGPSQTAADLVCCPQLAARHMIVDIDDPIGGSKKIVGSPVKISGVPEIDTMPPPRLGEHNRSILKEILGQREGDIAALEKDQII